MVGEASIAKPARWDASVIASRASAPGLVTMSTIEAVDSSRDRRPMSYDSGVERADHIASIAWAKASSPVEAAMCGGSDLRKMNSSLSHLSLMGQNIMIGTVDGDIDYQQVEQSFSGSSGKANDSA